jgi:hypothetical protein
MNFGSIFGRGQIVLFSGDSSLRVKWLGLKADLSAPPDFEVKCLFTHLKHFVECDYIFRSFSVFCCVIISC